MARNSEKAMTALARWGDRCFYPKSFSVHSKVKLIILLSRWRKAKEEEEGGMSSKMKAKRPYLASECDSVQMCEMYRQQVGSDSGK